MMASFFSCPSAYAWRFTPAAQVVHIMPFPGAGFDVRPTDMTGIAGCSELRVQKGYVDLTEGDVHAYLSLVLMANAMGKKLVFVINDADCYVYRIVLD